MKPIIGVMPLWDEERESIWMLPGYMDGIKLAGGIPVILPLCEDEETIAQFAAMCDGFLFTGGQDVSPEMYHENALDCVVSFEARDRMEAIVLMKAIEADKPVLGICRGIQFINACLGGTLYQDLKMQHASRVEHHQKPPYDKPIHKVRVIRDSPLYRCLGKELLAVNSYHHQAVKALAPKLSVMAVSTDGLIEAVCREESHFLWAVQWHPEFSFRTDENSMKIFRAFVTAMEQAGTLSA